jgi:16S rRNA C1402 N4-methylase RsmH
VASEKELEENSRSKSAKLRIVERVWLTWERILS